MDVSKESPIIFTLPEHRNSKHSYSLMSAHILPPADMIIKNWKMRKGFLLFSHLVLIIRGRVNIVKVK